MVDPTIFGQKETKGEGRRWRAVGAAEGRRKVLPSFLLLLLLLLLLLNARKREGRKRQDEQVLYATVHALYCTVPAARKKQPTTRVPKIYGKKVRAYLSPHTNPRPLVFGYRYFLPATSECRHRMPASSKRAIGNHTPTKGIGERTNEEDKSYTQATTTLPIFPIVTVQNRN